MLKGIGVSEGIGIGKALVIESHDIKFDNYAIRSVNEELERYHKAVEKFIMRTKEMANNIATNASEKEAEILPRILFQAPSSRLRQSALCPAFPRAWPRLPDNCGSVWPAFYPWRAASLAFFSIIGDSGPACKGKRPVGTAEKQDAEANASASHAAVVRSW